MLSIWERSHAFLYLIMSVAEVCGISETYLQMVLDLRLLRGELQCVHLCDKDTFFCVAGFESLDRVPSMFVLMGSFQSFSCNAATTDYAGVKANFTALAQLINDFTRIAVSILTTYLWAQHALMIMQR